MQPARQEAEAGAGSGSVLSIGGFTMKLLGTLIGKQSRTASFITRREPTRVLARGVALLALSVALASCTSSGRYNDFDTVNDITKKDFESLLGRSAPEKQQRSETEPPIPDFQSVLAAPSAPELADTRRVSIAVTETTPVRDILIELARKAQVDLELDPRIAGGIIMTATDRPFIEVIDRISDLAELRYRFNRNMLRVELDDPYLEQYRMDILNIKRSGSSQASSSTDASSSASAVGSGGGGSGNNKSATASSLVSKNRPWPLTLMVHGQAVSWLFGPAGRPDSTKEMAVRRPWGIDRLRS